MAIKIISPAATAPAAAPGKYKQLPLRPEPPSPETMALPDALLRRANILALTGWSETTLVRRIKRGDFPHPDVKTGSVPSWFVRTYHAWASMTPVERAKKHLAKLEAEGLPTGLAKKHLTNAHQLD